MSEQKQDEKVGALWSKSSPRGEFFTGNIELKPEQIAELQANGGKLAVVVFRNDKKTGKQPDWQMLRARPRGEQSVPDTGHNLNAEPVTDDAIPF